ncbi:dnaJ homolog subfamily C member 8-like [Ptychodera flava]|uniref:dnaJ homolog subfamily C member 8-like n=1 Tax=Ptychodera flava TaxID=63121 RepID=UPI00396A6D5B
MATHSTTGNASEVSSSTENVKPVKEGIFKRFMSEVKEIEERDSVLTSKQQIDRLLRPGSTYFNLNPFEVLQIDPATSREDIKKHYRKLSILVHPDKNIEDKDRAQQAFEAISKAWQIIQDDKLYKRCLEIISEAKEKTDFMIAEKRKKLKKEGLPTTVDEDDPAKLKHAVWVQTCKLFADLERQRRQLEEREMQERKRQREEEIVEEEKAKRQTEWEQKWEDSRDERVDSWRSWSSSSSSKKKKKTKAGFKPPKHKAETR